MILRKRKLLQMKKILQKVKKIKLKLRQKIQSLLTM